MPGRTLLRSLSHRNFRLFFTGQTLSLIGTWTQQAGVQWLLSRLTQSKALYGQIGFAAQLPALLFPPFTGVIVDRMNRRRLIMATQTVAMCQAFALAALVWSGHVQIWHVLVLNLLLSTVNSFDLPARQTFLGDLINDRDDLANAIALNSSMVNGARLFGPSLAAALMVGIGVEGCFAVNGLSFLAVLVALALMRIQRRISPTAHTPLWSGFREGWRYVVGDRPIRAALLITAAMSLCGLPYNLLLPYFTREVLHGDEWTYGLLLTAPGLGAFTAGMFIAWRGLRGLTKRLVVSPLIAAGSLFAASWCQSTPLAVICLYCAGFGFLTLLNSVNTLIQSIADEDKRGRVMGFYAICFTGMSPLGNLIVPALADGVGTPGALRCGAGACLIAGLIYIGSARHWRTEVRERLAKARTVVVEEDIVQTV
jgi:MFS family permease